MEHKTSHVISKVCWCMYNCHTLLAYTCTCLILECFVDVCVISNSFSPALSLLLWVYYKFMLNFISFEQNIQYILQILHSQHCNYWNTCANFNFLNWRFFLFSLQLVSLSISLLPLTIQNISIDEAELVKVVHDLCDKVILEVR